MGYGQSVGLVIIVVGILVSASFLGPTAVETAEEIAGGALDTREDVRDVKNLDFEITGTSYGSFTNQFEVTVRNTGSEAIYVRDVDVVVDGDYESDDADVTVEGDAGRTFISPGETATFTVTRATQPDRVQVTVNEGITRSTAV